MAVDYNRLSAQARSLANIFDVEGTPAILQDKDNIIKQTHEALQGSFDEIAKKGDDKDETEWYKIDESEFVKKFGEEKLYLYRLRKLRHEWNNAFSVMGSIELSANNDADGEKSKALTNLQNFKDGLTQKMEEMRRNVMFIINKTKENWEELKEQNPGLEDEFSGSVVQTNLFKILGAFRDVEKFADTDLQKAIDTLGAEAANVGAGEVGKDKERS